VGTRIELCGQLAVEIEGTRIEGSLRGRQGRLLLAYLVGGSGAVSAGGRARKPVKADTRAPKTIARVKRLRAGKLRLTLKARDASKIAATYVTVGGKRTTYRKRLVVTAQRLAKLGYGSVDLWGNAEAARKAPGR
jgi:hypothetical protein